MLPKADHTDDRSSLYPRQIDPLKSFADKSMLPPCIAAAPTQNEALHCIVMQHDFKSGQDNIIRSVYHCSELTC